MTPKKRITKTGVLFLLAVLIFMTACQTAPAPTQEPATASTQEPVAVQTQEPVAVKTEEPVAEKTQEPAAALTEEPVQAPTFDWKKYSGTKIKVYIADSGQAQYIQPKLNEFEELTGISVDFETADATSYRNGLPVQLTAQNKDLDVVATFTSVDGLQFAANGWYESLDKYIQDENLTSPDFDWGDFPLGAQGAMKVEGDTVSVLWEMQTDLLYYRKDLLEEKGLEVPKTFDEWLKAAEAVHNPSSDIYGVALRGAGYQMTTPFSAFLHSYCGNWVTDGKASINTPEAMQAFEMYGDWGQLGPPGIVNFDWQVPAQQFAQGKVFLFLDINLFVSTLEDPEKSAVAGKVGYVTVPEGPCGRSPFIGGWGYGISPFSEKKEAAWYFIQWATNKKLNLEMKLAGWPSPRASAWASEEFKAQDKTPEFTQVVLESLEIANAVMNPPVAPGKEAREIVGIVGNAALEGVTGSELQQVADEQNQELQKLIDAME